MRRYILISTVFNALASILPQLIGIFFLASGEFGFFSLVYLLYSLAFSVLLSVLCDAWVLTEGTGGYRGARVYISVLTTSSLLAAVLGGVGAYLTLASVLYSLLAAICVGMAVYRVGARYYMATVSSWRKVLISDSLQLAGIVGIYFWASYFMPPLSALFVSWLSGSFLACMVGPSPKFSLRSSYAWFASNGRTIKSLLTDSLAMNLAAIGTPFALLPFLGLEGFGLYRAIANLSAPFRLVLAPVRPLIMRSPARALSLRAAVSMGLSVLVLSASTIGFFELVRSYQWDLGVLAELSQFAVPAALYIAGALPVSLYSVVVRAHNVPRLLIICRLCHTAIGLLFPLTGFFIGGVVGAIWGFSAGSLASGALWLLAVLALRNGKWHSPLLPG